MSEESEKLLTELNVLVDGLAELFGSYTFYVDMVSNHLDESKVKEIEARFEPEALAKQIAEKKLALAQFLIDRTDVTKETIDPSMKRLESAAVLRANESVIPRLRAEFQIPRHIVGAEAGARRG